MTAVESRVGSPAGSRRYNATADLLDSNLEAGRAGETAISVVDGGDLTYGQLAAQVNRTGNAIRELGVQIEQRVLLALFDGPEFAAAFFGAIKAGAVPVPVNTNLKPADFAHFLNDSRAPAVIVSPALADTFRSIRPELSHLRHFIVAGESGPGELGLGELQSAASEELDPAPTSPDDMAFWLYTSGTTGAPKAAVHLQHDMRVCVDNYARPVLGLTAEDATFSVAKLYFAYGLGNSLYFPIAVGARTILLAGPPAPADVLRVVREERPTVYFGVPTSYAGLLAAGDESWATADFSSVRICVSAGEALPGTLLARWRSQTGLDVLDGIGSTEVCHIFVSNRIGDIRPDSSGREVPGYAVKIVDEAGAPVPDGEIGNLMVSGDSTCASYWNQHERTKQAIKGEWVDTGDKYIRDADGYLHHQGRSDDMLKAAGIWVSPVEVEAVINEHDAVLECAVAGVEDVDGLVKAEAYVILKPGIASGPRLADELRDHVRSRLAHYKCPRRFHFVDSLPKTATGKIQRFRLRQPTVTPAGSEAVAGRGQPLQRQAIGRGA
jgi:benzoate-CoA ligase family protein